MTTLIGFEFALAGVTFAVLLVMPAPYGRHLRAGWGPTLPARWGWALMESPSMLLFLLIFLAGPGRGDAVALILLAMWQLHYVHRAVLFPLRMRADAKRMPVLVALLAIAFNVLNSWNNAHWLTTASPLTSAWLRDPRFSLGVVLFGVGFAINLHSDQILFRLRGPGESGYRIPEGGLYRWVSSPNYLGEIVEWSGWALAAWSPAGLAFAVYTVANLLPRALENHRWYRARFPDYPRDRTALVPFVL